jgi:hypothetical protein
LVSIAPGFAEAKIEVFDVDGRQRGLVSNSASTAARTSSKPKESHMFIYGPPRQLDDGKPRKTEDDIQQELLGPRGVPGRPFPVKMTPQRAKKTPAHADPPHPA